MTTDFNFKVQVTKGELATIIDPIVYGDVITALQEPGMTMAGGLVRGQSLLNVLSETYGTKGIFLDNPKIAQIFDLLVYEGIMPSAERQKIAEYTAARLAAPPDLSPEISAPATHRWRLPEGVDPSDWFNQDIWPEALIGDGFLRVWTNATECLHPAAIKEV